MWLDAGSFRQLTNQRTRYFSGGLFDLCFRINHRIFKTSETENSTSGLQFDTKQVCLWRIATSIMRIWKWGINEAVLWVFHRYFASFGDYFDFKQFTNFMYDINRVYCCCFVKFNRQWVYPYQKIKWQWWFDVQTWKMKIGCNFGVIGCKKAAFKLFPPFKG